MPAFSPKLGHYELRGVLGCGGHGSVQKALDTSSGREVALKILIDATDADRPLREIRAAALLDHPGIARIYETGEENGRRFIAMELVEGSTLESILGKGLCLSRQRLTIRSRRSAALAAAHDFRTSIRVSLDPDAKDLELPGYWLDGISDDGRALMARDRLRGPISSSPCSFTTQPIGLASGSPTVRMAHFPETGAS